MNVEIPRCYSLELKRSRRMEIHTFSGASAYSTAIYLRLEFSSYIDVFLIASKARVAPLKTLTIPKLELLAVVLGVRLCSEVIKHLKLNISARYFWSDSRTIIQWLKSELPELVRF
ncbi:hypothetical protein JTB14_020758 [Gonioctena quinquepunctata]|nr:hypothetical protein JTB14_020758 [Gonioctena quinquepunctata]